MEASTTISHSSGSHDTTAIDPLVAATINTALEATVPKLDELITISVTYDNKGRWHDVQVSFREYLDLLHTGELDERKICAVEIYTYPIDVESEDETDKRVKMIYDFVQLHTERNPWRFA